ncbi:MAG: hypothetical protein ACLUKE_18160 [Blautia wexlerae]
MKLTPDSQVRLIVWNMQEQPFFDRSMAGTPKHTLSFVDLPGMPFHIPDPVKENQPMPFYDLPLPIEQIMEDVDAVIVTHFTSGSY